MVHTYGTYQWILVHIRTQMEKCACVCVRVSLPITHLTMTGETFEGDNPTRPKSRFLISPNIYR